MGSHAGFPLPHYTSLTGPGLLDGSHGNLAPGEDAFCCTDRGRLLRPSQELRPGASYPRPVVNTPMLPVQGVRGLILVGELRFYVLCDAAKKKKKTSASHTLLPLKFLSRGTL